jgi:predicted nucleic acid-binding OB-fold protein
MLSLLIDSAETHSPAVADSLSKARSTLDAEMRLDFLRSAKDSGQKLVDSLELLLRKMDEWEDFQEVLQITREILDFQKAIRTRTVEELESRKKPGGPERK